MNIFALVVLFYVLLAQCWSLALSFLANAIRIVPEYQRLVVFRLGRCVGAKGPGIVLLIPVIDRAVKVDLARAGARSAAPDFDHQG